MQTDDRAGRVLCVLAEEQAEAYQDDFRQLLPSGVDFVFPASVEQALDDIGSDQPMAVIVGMTIDTMEGLEFIAEAMARYRDYSGAFVVLPDKGDPFPPVVQRRDPSTGRSSTEHTDLGSVKTLLASLAEREVGPSGNGNGKRAAAHGFASLKPPGGGVVPRPRKASSSAAASAFGGGGDDPAAGSRPTQRPVPAASGIDASPTRPAPRGGILAQAQAASAERTPQPQPVPRPAEAAAAPAEAAPVTESERVPAAESASATETESESGSMSETEAASATEAGSVTGAASEPDSGAAGEVEAGAVGPVDEPVGTPPASVGAAPAAPVAADGASATASAPGRSAGPERRVPKVALAALAIGGLLALIMVVVIVAWVTSSGGDDPTAEPPAAGAAPAAPESESTAAQGGGAVAAPTTGEPDEAAAEPTTRESDEAAADEAEPRGEAGTVKTGSRFDERTALPLRFDQGEPSFEVEDPEAVERMVTEVARAMREHPEAELEVGGHTSGEGTEEYNRALGLRRAVRVRRQLEQRRIALDRIVVRSYGASEPASPDPEATANRRVTLRLLH